MSPDEQIDAAFVASVGGLAGQEGTEPGVWAETTAQRCWQLFDAQARSRHLDLAARWLRRRDQGYYTIGSAGHEGNVAVAAATRISDPALLHYRSGAFFCERARQGGIDTVVRDVLLGVVASAEDPASGGRHKVFGDVRLGVLPQTSTIASHLPRALGMAVSIGRAARLATPSPWPADAIVVASFGDASVNHSTATGAINAALHTAYQGIAVPLLCVCEDNGLGISVPTPPGWVARAYGDRPGLAWFEADGSDLPDALATAQRAVDWVRTHRRPAFLHLRTVRLMGHAGSDVESSYRSPSAIAAALAGDPLVGTARRLVTGGVADAADVVRRYEDIRSEVFAVAEEVLTRPRLTSAAQVRAPLAWPAPGPVAERVTALARPRASATSAAGTTADDEPTRALTLAQSINAALADVLAADPRTLVFGEDVAVKGGVYGVTRGLARRFGRARVFDTLLDEQSILGLALGAGSSGLLPIAEIQYLAYLHNAEDQLRGEAASQRFFSAGRLANPMILRVPGYGYQQGFGGHFHNDNAVGVLRDIPGLIIASPARPADAAAMLRTCVAAAHSSGAVSVVVEPIALYHTRDLHEPGDDGWLSPRIPPERWAETHVPLGRGRTHGTGEDLTLVTFGNGLRLSLRAARQLEREGAGVRVLDLRWLAPLPFEDLRREAEATGRVLVVDETRASGGVSEGVLTALVDGGFAGAMARVTSVDSYVPLGDAARLVLVSEEQVVEAARALLAR